MFIKIEEPKTIDLGQVYRNTYTECLLGADLLPKLGCKGAMLIKGKAFVRLESGGRQIQLLIKVSKDVTGLHLDRYTVNQLVEGYLEDKECEPKDLSVNGSYVVLGHHIFTRNKWSRVSQLSHPIVRVRIDTKESDYTQLRASYPHIAPNALDTVAVSGALSCLWSRKQFLESGFSMNDLLPVRHTMRAANRAPIEIDGAILIRFSGDSPQGTTYEAAAMVYVSPSTNSFFISKDVMVQLGIISPSFPQIGAANNAIPVSINASEFPGEKTFPNASSVFKTQNSSKTAPCGCR